mmetsp:Transcript_25735/g.60776  ORF Transcript_25735/g.60776 Transcript_25735/m.60776 type:complete len:264 (+) Transcript_25735:1825-2616(+)
MTLLCRAGQRNTTPPRAYVANWVPAWTQVGRLSATNRVSSIARVRKRHRRSGKVPDKARLADKRSVVSEGRVARVSGIVPDNSLLVRDRSVTRLRIVEGRVPMRWLRDSSMTRRRSINKIHSGSEPRNSLAEKSTVVRRLHSAKLEGMVPENIFTPRRIVSKVRDNAASCSGIVPSKLLDVMSRKTSSLSPASVGSVPRRLLKLASRWESDGFTKVSGSVPQMALRWISTWTNDLKTIELGRVPDMRLSDSRKVSKAALNVGK